MSAPVLVGYKGISNRSVMQIITEACHYLYQRRIAGDTPSIHYQQDCVVAMIDDAPVAVIVYKVYAEENYLFIYLGYVRTEYRGRGLYSKMWQHVKNVAEKAGVSKITSVTHPDNLEMRQIYSKQGRLPSAITYDYFLPTSAARSLALLQEPRSLALQEPSQSAPNSD